MKNLKISTRLTISILLFVVPLAILLYAYIGTMSATINTARLEMDGNAYLRPVVKALNQVSDHLTFKLRLQNGDSSAQAELVALTGEINNSFAEIGQVNDQYGVDLQFTDEGLAMRKREAFAYPKLLAQWKAIASADMRSISDDQYLALIDGLRGMAAHVGDTSGLILDPDLDSYYVMDATVALSGAIVRNAESERDAYALLAKGGVLEQEDKARFESYANMINQNDKGRVDTDMDTAYNEDANFYQASATLKANTQPKLAAYDKATDNYIAALHGMVKNASLTPVGLLQKSQAAGDAAYQFWVAATDELDILLQARMAHFESQRNMVVMMFALNVLIAFGFYWYVTNGIKQSLKKLQIAMVEIADGKLDFPVPCLELRDEVGSMARTLEIFRETSIEAQRMEKEQQEEVQKKNARQQQVDALIKGFEIKISSLLQEFNRATGEMQGAAETMAGISGQTTEKSAATISVTQETSQNVSAVATAAEELSASIGEISRQVSRGVTITQNATNTMKDTDTTVKQLADSAQKIDDVVVLINSIAEQIDLLALNATIESARAGDAGKGFAVVANEVKHLASETSKATGTISGQISEVQKMVGMVVKALSEMHGTMDEINNVTSTIASAVEEQGAATKEIAMTIQRVSDRIGEVSSNVGQVGDMAVATNDNAKSVLGSVRVFSDQSTSLQNEVEGFLGGIAKA